MPSLSQVQIIGHLGGDAEKKLVDTNTVVTFSVAVSGRGQVGQKTTTWYRVSAWNKVAEGIQPHLLKGSLVYVNGRLELRPWTTANGEERLSLDVAAQTVLLLTKAEPKPDEEFLR
jgi:single-strand DNA-binding protein